MSATCTACATATGGHSALIRLSGSQATAIAARAGVALGPAWTIATRAWPLAGGACPCRVLFAPRGRSFTGEDLVEIVVPGSPALVAIALDALIAAGAEPAAPGAFTRMALANGRISLDQAEAIHALVTAPGAAAARRALARLSGALASELGAARERLIAARAQVEAGLDFLDEDDVRAYDPAAMRALLAELRATLARWRRAADGLGEEPVVLLVGPANAGKSALFARLTGAPALVSPIAGTTRDWLDAPWRLGARRVRLIDTAGWLDATLTERDGDAHARVDRDAVARGRALVDGAALVLACDAPDASLPIDHGLPADRVAIVATKRDLAATASERAGSSASDVACSAATGAGCDELVALVARRLDAVGVAEPRQRRLLDDALAILDRVLATAQADVLLADDLLRIADLIGELTGATTPDDVLAAIFSRFCIGK